LGESGEVIELPVTAVRAENDWDCYGVEIAGTPVEEWISSGTTSPIYIEIVENESVLLR
jgi:hypothetical protein